MKYYYLLILFLFSISCFTQDSLIHYNKKIIANFKKNDLNKSNILFNSKLNYLKNQDNLEEYFYAHFDYFMLNQTEDRIFILNNSDIKKWRKPTTIPEKIAKLHVLINIAYHLKEFGTISQSVNAYENALYFYENEKINNYDIVEYCLKPLANNYTRLGDYNRAEEVIKNTINILETTNNKEQLIATYSNLSILYQSINQNKKAITLLQKALTNGKLNKQQKSTLYVEIGKNLYQLNELDKAIIFNKKALSLKPNNVLNQKIQLLNGLISFKKDQYTNALKSFKASLNLASQLFGKKNREVSKIHILIAKTQIKLNNLNIGLKNYQNALTALLPSFIPKNEFENPLPENLYAENTLLDIFEGKATVFRLLNKNQLAITNLELANTVANLLRNTFTAQNSKIIQQTKNRKRTEKIVELYYNLYLKTKEKQYVTKAFYSIEKSKATVLNSILQNKFNIKSFANDTLFTLKEKLEKQKAVLDKNILLEEFKEKKANVNYLKNQIALKTRLTTKLVLVNEQIKLKYPILSTYNDITIAEIQKELLIDNHLLITFFETKNQWFIFSLTKKNDLKLRVLPKDKTLYNNISNYINFFFNGNDNALKNDISLYQDTGHFLYQKLLQPELLEQYKYITLIPDNKLNFLAFDALLTEPTNSTNFANYPYLVKNHAINTSFSCNILALQKQNEINNSNKSIAGYFPVFKNKERTLQTLTHTLEEQKYFNKYTNGFSLLEAKASKKHFLDNYKNYSKIHLATHASAGSLVQPAQIEFYDETLYLPEIYGLNMQTDLLVLSACETGIGKMLKGEGIMSLARGFTYAGVKNLVVSLWKVNDKATSELMANFYKNLKSNSKVTAVQLAKLDYLKDPNISSIKKSPYYWSSFVFVGNTYASTNTNYWCYLLIGIGLILMILMIKRLLK